MSEPGVERDPEPIDPLEAGLAAAFGPDGTLPVREEAARTSSSDEKLKRLRARPAASEARYQFDGEIGRGGMGAVLRVRDLDLGRNLAMKVILAKGGDAAAAGGTPVVDPQVLQRFLDEAQITGQLDHPGVVPVHELGIDAAGRVYFTMRLVRGKTADEVFAAARQGRDGWTQTRALEVVLKVCDTMAFAHEKGVLHRDLKASNVMVGKFGEVYVMDWGLAKVLGEVDGRDLRLRPMSTAMSKVVTDRSKDESDSNSPLLTMDGAVVGTPCYMAPEQAEGHVDLLDQRTDVYAVGAMLYQLLTGRQPYVNPGARVSPYAVLAAVQAGPPVSVNRLDTTAPAELVAIVERAMARDREQRYANTSELAADLRAFLAQRVVRAYRTGPIVELSLWVRRNRALATLGAAAILILVAGVVGTTGFAWRAARNQAAAERGEALARLQAAQANVRLGARHEALRQLQGIPPAWRGWEWNHLHLEADPSLCSWETAGFEHCAPMPDGKQVVTAESGHRIRIRDLETGALVREVGKHEDRVTCITVDPTTGRIATGSLDLTVQVWASPYVEPMAVLRGQVNPPSAVLFTHQGTRVVSADGWAYDPSRSTRSETGPGHLYLWDTATGRLLAKADGDGYPVFSLASSADRIVAASRSIRVFRGAAPDELVAEASLPVHDGERVYRAIPTSDGKHLYSCGSDHQVRLWGLDEQKLLATWALPKGWHDFASSADGSRFISVTAGLLQLWSRDSPGEAARLDLPGQVVAVGVIGNDVAFAATSQGHFRAWDARTRSATTQIRRNDHRFLTGSSSWHGFSGEAEIFTPGSGQVEAGSDSDPLLVQVLDVSPAAAFHPGTRQRASWRHDHSISIDAPPFVDGGFTRHFELPPAAHDELGKDASPTPGPLVFSGDGTMLASCLHAPSGKHHVSIVRVWNLQQQTCVQRLVVPHLIGAVALDQARKLLVCGASCACGRVMRFQVSSGELLQELSPPEGWQCSALLWLARSDILVAGFANGRLLQWNGHGKGDPVQLDGHRRPVSTLVADDAETRIVSGSEDGTIRVWDAGTATCLLVLGESGGPAIRTLQLSDGSRRLAAYDGTDILVFESALADARVAWRQLALAEAAEARVREGYAQRGVGPGMPRLERSVFIQRKLDYLRQIEQDPQLDRSWRKAMDAYVKYWDYERR